MIDNASLLKDALNEHFGFNSFKGNQQEIIESVLAGKDTFVIMPTGGGKSLCYQLPALLSQGTAIIISPLIALMKNQVDQMRSYSSKDHIAHFMNSSLTKRELRLVKEDLQSGKTKMLYVAPETLKKEENLQFFSSMNVSFVAVDEAHCISEWGHDFRPEYRQIRKMINSMGGHIPIIALTATATPKVRSDIIKNLGLQEPTVYISSFNRPNLYYELRSKRDKKSALKSITKYITTMPGKSGIVYCLNRKTTEEIAATLRVNGIKAAAYHAGMDSSKRSLIQDQFLMEELEVICATIAFGMGIDKPDVRFVIHFDIPKSIENYYQETGRAGRDGLEGQCIAYYSYKDIQKLEKFMRDKSVAEREMTAQLLTEIVAYAETSVCRRKFLLHYFGEGYELENCKNCDNCNNPKEKIDGAEFIIKAIECVQAVKENQSIPYLVNLLTGKETQEIQTFKHHELDVFGSGRDRNEHFWNSVLRQCLINNLLYKSIEDYGLIKLTREGLDFLKKPRPIKISLNHDYDDAEDISMVNHQQRAVVDPVLLGMLKDLRRKVARQKNLPPYIIFQDNSLEDMATQYPVNRDELTKIAGVSAGKAMRYGKKFTELIADYVEENDIDRAQDFVMKSVVNKSGHKVYIIQNIDKQIPLEDIAHAKGMKMNELLDELETIVSSGTRLNIDYYINNILDDYQQEDAYDFFRNSETGNLQEAYDELREEGFTVEELQLMKIKFMSEQAN